MPAPNHILLFFIIKLPRDSSIVILHIIEFSNNLEIFPSIEIKLKTNRFSFDWGGGISGVSSISDMKINGRRLNLPSI